MIYNSRLTNPIDSTCLVLPLLWSHTPNHMSYSIAHSIFERYKEKDIYIDRLSFHKVERSDLTNVLNTTLMILLSITFVLFTMLKVREEQIHFWFCWCFPPTGPMHLISTLSLWAGHILRNMEEFYNSQTLPSEGPGSTSTNTLSRMLPTPHFELLGKRRTWVTPYQEVQTSRSAPESNDAPKEWTRWEDLFRRLKTLNPHRKVKSVVIHIYPFLHSLFVDESWSAVYLGVYPR